MKSVYSIVYSTISSISQERLNLGMIMLDNHQNVSFKYSTDKLDSAKKLFSDQAFKLIKSNLKATEQRISNKGDLINNLENFTKDYLSYLSNYSNNLIAYSKPTPIEIDLTEENFDKLFEKFVYKIPIPEVKVVTETTHRIFKIKNEFIPKVKNRVNVDVELRADDFDFVMFNTRIDMMGKNDRPVLNQFIDFENTTAYRLEKQLNSYIGLIKPLELIEGEIGKYFIVGEEPKNREQSKIWNHLNDSTLIKQKVLEIVNPDETEKVEIYLDTHGVEPYFGEID